MAEGIFGLVFGSLGFILTVRNGIERVVQDKDAFKQHTDGLIYLSARLDLLSMRLELWQKYWYIDDGSPNHLFASYWGEEGSHNVRNLLANIQHQTGKIEQKFEEKYGHIARACSGRRLARAPKSERFDKSEDVKFIQVSLDMSAKTLSWPARLNQSLFTVPIFLKHPESLEASVKLLEDFSMSSFAHRIDKFYDNKVESRIADAALRSHLTCLAKDTLSASQVLRNMALEAQNHHVDFCLDYSSDPATRREILFEFARRSQVTYHLCLQPCDPRLEIRLLKLQCQVMEKALASDQCWQHNLHHACESSHPRSYLRSCKNDVGFAVSKHEMLDQEVKSLRAYVIENREDFAENLHGEFSRRERIRIAYELVESALLYHQAGWFSQVCSCSVFRFENNSLKTSYALRSIVSVILSILILRKGNRVKSRYGAKRNFGV